MSENEIKSAIEEGGRLAGIKSNANKIATGLGYASALALVYALLTGKPAATSNEVAFAVRDMILRVPANVRNAWDREGGPMPYETNPATTFSTESGFAGTGDFDDDDIESSESSNSLSGEWPDSSSS